MNRTILVTAGFAAALMLAGCAGDDTADSGDPTVAEQTPIAGAPAGALKATALPGGGVAATRIDARLRNSSGPVDVWVTLDEEPVAATQVRLAKETGATTARKLSSGDTGAFKSAMTDQRSKVVGQQIGASKMLMSLGAEELGRVQIAHNAIAVRVDASQLDQIAFVPGVKAVRPVIHYELDLSETVPYVGGAAVQAGGTDGAGVRVAVLDSGIDYTHRNLGGPGTEAAYVAAWGTGLGDPAQTTLDGLFPTAKVVDGFDFVGELWPTFGPRTEDPDPIDLEGHGTHVADIIAGQSTDGLHKGMAPGARLLAVKVCSAVSSSCNGIALLKGVDFALDPNGDGDLSDAVDVINMSLGSGYGQIEDDLSGATANAVAFGVTVVASAGNSGDRPYITGSPSSTPGAISVAQTQVPSAEAIALTIDSPASIAGAYSNTATVDWAPVGSGFSGGVAFVGRGCDTDAYLDDPAGKVVLIDRGACAISQKVRRASDAGATGVLLGLVAPGDAQTFSNGGECPAPADGTCRGTLVITQATANLIKANIAAPVVVTVDPNVSTPLAGSMVASSSRGPNVSFNAIKPEIGAPGASVSAIAGSGTAEEAFGGTSGAAPMVAGAAALLLSGNPDLTPAQVKALLMNSAETEVYTNPATQPGVLAPITRIGAGELRVDRAAKLSSLAYDADTGAAALSFGQHEVPLLKILRKRVQVENLGSRSRSFRVDSSFRYADDEASGAVRILAPRSVYVRGHGTAHFDVLMIIQPRNLPEWTLNGGSQGGNGPALNGPEYDGYITLQDGSEKLSLPWHVLPRKASLTTSLLGRHKKSDAVFLSNLGNEVGNYDVFSLMDTSDQIPGSDLPGPGDNIAVVDLRAVGVRYLPDAVCGVAGGCLEFAMSVWGRNAHPLYPRGIDIEIDTTGDGLADYFVTQQENGAFASSGQSVAFVGAVGSTLLNAFFFNDSDLNSGNVIYTVPMALLGGLAPGTTIQFDAVAYDNYFTGTVSDVIAGMRFTPASPRFGASEQFGSVDSFRRLMVPVSKNDVADALSSEQGLLFMYRRNAVQEADIVRMR